MGLGERKFKADVRKYFFTKWITNTTWERHLNRKTKGEVKSLAVGIAETLIHMLNVDYKRIHNYSSSLVCLFLTSIKQTQSYKNKNAKSCKSKQLKIMEKEREGEAVLAVRYDINSDLLHVNHYSFFKVTLELTLSF